MADDDYYPPLVHRSRYRPDETPFDPLQGVSPAPSPFEMFNPAPVNPFGSDSVDSSTADVKAAYDREQDYKDSIFGKIAGMEIPQFGAEGSAINRVIDNANNPQLEGGGASVFGKMLGAVGIDGDGSRANTTWGQSLPNTATMLNPFAMASEGVKSASRWLGALKYPEKLETPDMLAPFGGAAMVAPFAPVHAVGSAGGKLRPARLKPDMEGEPGYAYHATNTERLYDIADSGELRTHEPWDFTDQDMWPDGALEPRAYFLDSPGGASMFAPEDGTPTVLRTKMGDHIRKESTGDLYTRDPIKSDALEFLSEDGQ
jgi:hypothetical protein